MQSPQQPFGAGRMKAGLIIYADLAVAPYQHLHLHLALFNGLRRQNGPRHQVPLAVKILAHLPRIMLQLRQGQLLAVRLLQQRLQLCVAEQLLPGHANVRYMNLRCVRRPRLHRLLLHLNLRLWRLLGRQQMLLQAARSRGIFLVLQRRRLRRPRQRQHPCRHHRRQHGGLFFSCQLHQSRILRISDPSGFSSVTLCAVPSRILTPV